jgi:hypothetical protein
MNRLEILFWNIAKWLIRRGWGAYCESSDIDDFPDMWVGAKNAAHPGRCGSCRAKEIIEWIDMNIEMLKED